MKGDGVERLEEEGSHFRQKRKCLVPSFKWPLAPQRTHHLLCKELCDNYAKGTPEPSQHSKKRLRVLRTGKGPLKKGQTEDPRIAPTCRDPELSSAPYTSVSSVTSTELRSRAEVTPSWTLKQVGKRKPRAMRELAQGNRCAQYWGQDSTQSPRCSNFPHMCPLAWGFLMPTLVVFILFKICLSVFSWVLTTSPITRERIRGWLHICSLFSSKYQKLNGNENPQIFKYHFPDPMRNYFP